MKRLSEYINEAIERRIKLPYTFDIYNSGSKNVNHKITKNNIYRIFFAIDDSSKDFMDNYDCMIKLPLAPNQITYKEHPTKSNTSDWTKVPEINEWTYAGAWYSDKWVEYNYNRYNRDWDAWLNSLKPYMSGKISVTLREDTERSWMGQRQLVVEVNNSKFNAERNEKIAKLKDPENLQTYAAEAKRREDEIKRKEEERRKAQEEHEKWWNSLSDGERLSWSMGYGQGRYMGD